MASTEDQFDPCVLAPQTHWSMPSGSRYAGQSIDASSRRSIQIVSHGDREKLIDPQDDQVTVNHFYHEGEFWRALIPLNSIEEVYGQSFNFSKKQIKRGVGGPKTVLDKHGVPKRTNPALNHLQSRFKLRPQHPIQLYPLAQKEAKEPVHRIIDFVYSLEAVGPLGISFNLRDGLAGNLVSAHRILSTQEMAFERLAVEGQVVIESPAIPLDESGKRAALIESLLRSHCAGMSEPYYLYCCCGTNNCTSNPFQILDKVAKYKFRHRIGSLLYRLPFSPRFYLRIRGLDVDPSVRKLLRDEFAEYIQDPATQTRKRQYVRARTRALREARKARQP